MTGLTCIDCDGRGVVESVWCEHGGCCPCRGVVVWDDCEFCGGEGEIDVEPEPEEEEAV